MIFFSSLASYLLDLIFSLSRVMVGGGKKGGLYVQQPVSKSVRDNFLFIPSAALSVLLSLYPQGTEQN